MRINTLIRDFLVRALEEDIGTGDITTELTIPDDTNSEAIIIAKEDFLLAGLPFSLEVFSLLSDHINVDKHHSDGSSVKSGDTIAKLSGPTRALLAGERLALNILQRLSGIATLTKRFVSEVEGTGAKVLDTRKTMPLMRYMEKYAVKIGGGYNHRFGLYDGILIKDNHIKAAGGVARAIELARSSRVHLMKIEIEVKNLDELREALQAGADVVMLDNMELPMLKEAVALARQISPTTLLEASGGVRLDNVREIAQTGVDFISIGALTHSATAVDISMKII